MDQQCRSTHFVTSISIEPREYIYNIKNYGQIRRKTLIGHKSYQREEMSKSSKRSKRNNELALPDDSDLIFLGRMPMKRP